MIPLAIPNLAGNEGKYLQECVTSNFVSSVGPFVNKFEEMVAAKAGGQFCTATSSGTTSLHVSLISVGVQRDCLVIVPSFTFIASVNAVSYCGAVPWLFDIDCESWSLDPALLEQELKKHTFFKDDALIHRPSGRRVAAIMPVYTLGTPADMDRIYSIARDYQLPVIADAAAALGAKYKNRNLAELADLSVFSFNGNKTVTAGGGGAVVGNNNELVDLAHHISTTARVGIEYHHDRVGYNYRMTNIQAAVGCAQLELLDKFIEAKRKIRAGYDDAFKDIKGIRVFPQPAWAESACWFSGIIIEDSNKFPDVPLICEKLKERGIAARTFWKPIHLQPPYIDAPRTKMDVSDEIWAKILTLPCSTSLTETDQKYVSQSVKEILHI